MVTSVFSMPTYSSQYSQDKALANLVEGHLCWAWSQVRTYATADGDVDQYEFNLFTLPPGRLIILPRLSQINTTQFEATADLHLGYRSYTDENGLTVAEDDNAFMDNVDVGGGALSGVWSAITGVVTAEPYEIQTVNGLTLFVMIDTADIENADTLSVSCAYVRMA